MTKNFRAVAIVMLAMAFVYAFPVNASAVTLFDFEGAVGGPSVVELSDGIIATITKADGSNITTPGPLGPASWGNRSLLAFASGANLIITFSVNVSGASIEFGDFNQDSDVETLQAYAGVNGTGAFLGSDTLTIPGTLDIGTGGDAAVSTLSVGAAGIRSLVIVSPVHADNPFPMSVFWDNLRVNTAAVPEPATLVLLGLGAIGIAAAYRKNRA